MPAGDPLSRHPLIPTRNATKKVTVKSKNGSAEREESNQRTEWVSR
jgi:hypothetical protein